ncbi:MAG TPA: hypothetical protein VK964_04045 [Nocardioidaceae bacterium]|nr:hypothetical protein [Nocardioidaceae bacterium]
MPRTFDVELQDMEQIDEIELLAELMVLASETRGALDLSTIDATLGLGSAFPQQRRTS